MPPDHPELLALALAGDGAALTALLTASYAPLRNYVAGKTPKALQGVVDADDIVQETHIEVFRRIGAFEVRGPDAFERWLRVIALSRLRNALKRQRAAKRGGGRVALTAPANLHESIVALLDVIAVHERTPSRSMARREAGQAVQTALGQLTDDHRQAVQLVYLEGASAAEAAARMGRSEHAIHHLCHKARGRLRELLKSRARYLSES